jgi:hypothetical protein
VAHMLVVVLTWSLRVVEGLAKPYWFQVLQDGVYTYACESMGHIVRAASMHRARVDIGVPLPVPVGLLQIIAGLLSCRSAWASSDTLSGQGNSIASSYIAP